MPADGRWDLIRRLKVKHKENLEKLVKGYEGEEMEVSLFRD